MQPKRPPSADDTQPLRPRGAAPPPSPQRQDTLPLRPTPPPAQPGLLPPPPSPPDPMSQFQAIRIKRRPPRRQIPLQPPRQTPPRRPAGPRRSLHTWLPAAALITLPILGALLLVAFYLLAPLRTNFLILGIDRAPEGSALGRSDIMVVVSVVPLQPQVSMLSIPRDLWVNLPGGGENRINTAHYFAEAEQPGSGPTAARAVVEQNFGVRLPYYLRLRFDGFKEVIDALGGVTITLEEATALYPAGTHHLDGTQALAFVRDRKNADDFFRMRQTQLMIISLTRQALQPASWPRLPGAAAAFLRVADTNIPPWQYARLGLALLRAVAAGSLDHRTITREMVTPFTTASGANVLLPHWEPILQMTAELFGG